MKFKASVWALSRDSEDGTEVEIFATEKALEDHLSAVILKHLNGEELGANRIEDAKGIRYQLAHGDFETAWATWDEQFRPNLDTYVWEERELELDGRRVGSNRMFIVVEGGVVQDVLADDDTMECFLIDHDNGDMDDKEKAENAEKVKACEGLGSLTIQ